MTLPRPLDFMPGFGPEDDPETGAGNTDPVTLPVPVAVPGNPGARSWLSAALSNRHLGGGEGGLGAYFKNPRPEPLVTHVRHAGVAFRYSQDPDNENRAAARAAAAYHLLAAVPLKAAAKTVRHVADVLDSAPDHPHILIFLAVTVAVFAVVFFLL